MNFQEGAYTLDRLPQIRRHRGFAVSRKSVIVNPDLHIRRRGPGIGGHRESVTQLQLIRRPGEFHPGFTANAIGTGRGRSASGKAGQGEAGGRSSGTEKEGSSVHEKKDWSVTKIVNVPLSSNAFDLHTYSSIYRIICISLQP